jgi:hypothetical protein
MEMGNKSSCLVSNRVVLTIGDDTPVHQGHCIVDKIGYPVNKEEF